VKKYSVNSSSDTLGVGLPSSENSLSHSFLTLSLIAGRSSLGWKRLGISPTDKILLISSRNDSLTI